MAIQGLQTLGGASSPFLQVVRGAEEVGRALFNVAIPT